MAAETTPQRGGGGIIILGRVVGAITGLVAGGIAGVGCKRRLPLSCLGVNLSAC